MKLIDLQTWPRKEHYLFFKSMDYPQYNLCFNIDVTRLVEFVRKSGLPFYYVMIYYATRATDGIEEFRYRIQNDQVVLHDKLHPSFTDIKDESELFKMVIVDMEDSLESFVKKADETARKQKRFFVFDELGSRDDLIYITSIPWISFTHISHTINLKSSDAVPRISWGKYFEDRGAVWLPFSVQVNHAFVDGVHVGKYKDVLEGMIREAG